MSPMEQKKILQLVPFQVSSDTVSELRTLLEQAEKGELIGLAYVGMYRGSDYDADVVGTCRRSTDICQAMLRRLERALDHLQERWRS